MIEIRIYADEVVFRLDQLPKKIRQALSGKFEEIFGELRGELFSKTPGKYLDQSYIQTGVTELGSTVVGFIEAQDKPGVYPIYPSKANMLRFFSKSGELVFARQVLLHPFLKGTPIVERVLRESKPWILEELQTAVYEAL